MVDDSSPRGTLRQVYRVFVDVGVRKDYLQGWRGSRLRTQRRRSGERPVTVVVGGQRVQSFSGTCRG